MKSRVFEISKNGHRAKPDPRGQALHLRERMKTGHHTQADICPANKKGGPFSPCAFYFLGKKSFLDSVAWN